MSEDKWNLRIAVATVVIGYLVVGWGMYNAGWRDGWGECYQITVVEEYGKPSN